MPTVPPEPVIFFLGDDIDLALCSTRDFRYFRFLQPLVLQAVVDEVANHLAHDNHRILVIYLLAEYHATNVMAVGQALSVMETIASLKTTGLEHLSFLFAHEGHDYLPAQTAQSLIFHSTDLTLDPTGTTLMREIERLLDKTPATVGYA